MSGAWPETESDVGEECQAQRIDHSEHRRFKIFDGARPHNPNQSQQGDRHHGDLIADHAPERYGVHRTAKSHLVCVHLASVEEYQRWRSQQGKVGVRGGEDEAFRPDVPHVDLEDHRDDGCNETEEVRDGAGLSERCSIHAG